MRIGVVVQRYGQEVVGGSETLARDICQRLAERGHELTVFTSAAQDYLTWRNHFPAGESWEKGVLIKRFNSAGERDIGDFNLFSESFFAQNPGERDEAEWIARQGPNCPALVDALRNEQQRFDLFLFFTYLYYPVVAGMKAVTKPIVFFPTAHDEPPLHLELMKALFRRPQQLFFLTGAEMELVQRVFSPPGRLELLRTGLEINDRVDANLFRERYLAGAPYLLFAGRIEKGKGLEAVFDFIPKVRRQIPLELVLIGKKLMDVPDVDGIRYVGFVPEEEKLSAFKGALASVQPSPLESLSITTLESFSQKTPALVNRLCPALVEHIELSGGGLAYGNEAEFTAAVNQFFKKPKLRQKMGKAGYEYVKMFYSWDSVLEKIEISIKELTKN